MQSFCASFINICKFSSVNPNTSNPYSSNRFVSSLNGLASIIILSQSSPVSSIEKQTYFPIKSVEEYASNIKNNFFVFFNWLRYFSSRFNYDFHNQSTDVIYIINTEENKPFLIIILNEYYELNDETKLNEVIKIILKERRMISTFVPKKILDALNKVCKKDVKFK